jgi:hypothetical protein
MTGPKDLFRVSKTRIRAEAGGGKRPLAQPRGAANP